MKQEKKASIMAIVGNSILFVGKIIVGYLFNSIAIISDALNSFTDIIASSIVHVSLLVSYRGADKDHQFGHTRAQPIAGLIVAIFTGIVGFQVIVAGAKRIMEGGEIEKGLIPILLVFFVAAVKIILYIYTCRVCKRTGSTALQASSVDHRNDLLIEAAVLFGIVASNIGYSIFDPLVAIIIGIYIIKSGYSVGRDNIRFLMGDAPSEDLFLKIEKEAKSVTGVIGLNDVRAHYVGTEVQVEIHIYVDKDKNVRQAHDIGKKVQSKIELMDDISRAFVHIDPFMGRFERERKF